MKSPLAKVLSSFLLFFLLPPLYPVLAANFSISPGDKRVAVGELFDVFIDLDTEGTRVLSADVKLGFDADTIAVVQIHDGDFFAAVSSQADRGSIILAGSGRGKPVVGSGRIATVTLRGRSGGVTGLTFLCTPGKKTDLTNIVNEDNEDIADCHKLISGIYTVSSPGFGDAAGTTSATRAATPIITTAVSPRPTLSPAPSAPKKIAHPPSIVVQEEIAIGSSSIKTPLLLFSAGILLVITGFLIVLL